MFDPTEVPRVFGTAPGVDFPRALVDGLIDRTKGQPPETLARVQLIVNTRRMARRIRDLFDAGPAVLLPRISLLTDLGAAWDLAHIPQPIAPMRRRLELSQLVSALLEAQPDLAPRSSLYDLSDSLATLMDEMQGEGVLPSALEALDITDQSGHWQRIKSFLGIVQTFFDPEETAPDHEARQRLIIDNLCQKWQDNPPDHQVILAGSTGSRGATRAIMRVIAQLPQGAILLPGMDFDTPDAVWDTMGDAMVSEDHPQYRFAHFMQEMDSHPRHILDWGHGTPASPERNKIMSLALRPAPVTDQWLRDGPALKDIPAATQALTLVEAPSPRAEAMAIAMRLRQAAEDGQTAALITPDRTLTRQVTAALDHWHITPDDSAGLPLHLSPPGRFLRHVSGLFGQTLTAEMLLTLLKHPITHSGAERGLHLLLTRELELHLRRYGPPYPDQDALRSWAASRKEDGAMPWADWLCSCFTDQEQSNSSALSDCTHQHIALAEKIAAGSAAPDENTGYLWHGDAGQIAQSTMADISDHAAHGGRFSPADYSAFLKNIMSRKEVRNAQTPHPNILIWGTLEARVQGADLLILAGLNEGTWPEAPKPDPWLNRALRHQAGLLLPERRIGLSAHDFQQAIAAPEVWMTRSIRSDDAEAVPSRWLNRLGNLLEGLPAQNGPEALKDMRARGQHWLSLATQFEAPTPVDPAPRPSPCPPPAAQPRKLSVTEIKRLIRDPYAIYARHVLRLRPLDPLMRMPDALLRGIVLHEVLEQFVRDTLDHPDRCTNAVLMATAREILLENVPWASARATWLARLERAADWFTETELGRRTLAHPTAFEVHGSANFTDLDFTLTAMADRIDLDRNGALHIYDYKTGTPPSTDEQLYFDKQLLLEAAIAERSGFGDIAPGTVARAVYIGLGNARENDAPLESEPPGKTWQALHDLLDAYLSGAKGFTSRRAMHSKRDRSDYDQLARFGEWDITDDPVMTGPDQ